MLQNTHFGAGSDALKQVHGAGVKVTVFLLYALLYKFIC